MVLLYAIFLTSALFSSARINVHHNKQHIDSKYKSNENFFTKNNKKWNFGLETSYLYWMIGTHCTYANIFKSQRIHYESSGPMFLQPFFYLKESQCEILSDNSVCASGLSARLSAMSKNKKGWEYGVKYQWIKHKDDPLECCPRQFSNGGWLWNDHPAIKVMPFTKASNGLLAVFNLGHEASKAFTTSMIDLSLIGFRLDKVYQTFDFHSGSVDLSNFGLLFNSDSIRFGFGFGLEFDVFKNIIEVRGGQALIDIVENNDIIEDIGINGMTAYYFAYKLKNKPFSIGPFVKIDGALHCPYKNHLLLINAGLYGAGLYTQNNYKQYFEKTDMAYKYYQDYIKQHGDAAIPPSSTYPSVCSLQYGCPDFCYEPRTTMYHAKVTLGVKYEFLMQDYELHAGIDWETNSFLNFFDRDFLVYSHDDLNFQGLTATFGVSF